jgi:uncharacterized Zn finger protein
VAARAALDRLLREGRALYDPDGDAWLARRLFTGAPPPPPASAEREKLGQAIVKKGGVAIREKKACREGGTSRGATRVEARVKGDGTYDVTAILDANGALLRGICSCPFFSRLGLERGPCKHLLALALAAR